MSVHKELIYEQLTPNIHSIHLFPDRNLYRSIYRFVCTSGSFFERPEVEGITHLMEHCVASVLDDTQSTTDMNKYLHSKNMASNASTNWLTLKIWFEGHRDNSEEMSDHLLKMALHPSLREDILEQERKVVTSEIVQYEGSPRYQLSRYIAKKLYKRGSIGRTNILGTEKSVANITFGDIKRRHKDLLREGHLVFVSIGEGMERERFIDKILERTSELKFPKIQKMRPVDFDPPNNFRQFHYLPIVHQFGHKNADISVYIPCDIRYENSAARFILSEILFDQGAGSLYNHLRNDLGIIYSLDDNFSRSDQLLKFYTVCDIENVEKVIEELRKALFKVDVDNIANQLSKIKELTRKREELLRDSPFYEADKMQSYLLSYGKPYTLEDYIDQLNRTTVHDVLAVFTDLQKNLERMKVIIVSSDEKIQFLKVF